MAESSFSVKNKEIFTYDLFVNINFPYFFLAAHRWFCFKGYMHPVN